MPIDKILENIEGIESRDEFLELALTRIEGFRGLPLEPAQKERYLQNAFDFIKRFMYETPKFFSLEYNPQNPERNLNNLVLDLKQRDKAVRVGAKDAAEGDVIFSYLIGAIEDRNRLLDENFYPARGHDYYWGLVNQNPARISQDESEKLIEKYNFKIGIKRDHFKPIRLPTDLLHGHFFTTMFQFFED